MGFIGPLPISGNGPDPVQETGPCTAALPHAGHPSLAGVKLVA